MQNIYFGPDERAHQKFLDFFYIVCGLLCLALAILSLFPAGAGMREQHQRSLCAHWL